MKIKKYRILIGGDLLPSGNNIPLFEHGDIQALFGEEICQLFAAADFSIINLEGPLTDSEIRKKKAGPAIKAPKACVQGIKALGITGVALANNHITDYGQSGYEDTLDALNKAGIQHVGSGKMGMVKSHLMIRLGIKRICIYNVSETFFNSPEKDIAGANLYDEYLVCNEIKELRKMCDYMIVIYHGGAEYLPYPSPQTRTRFHRMADCGADFITAQHTHCIGCEEWYNGTYLLYGQGNFLFARQKKYPQLTKEGLVSEICISDDGFTIENHLVKIDGHVLKYDADQDLTSFYERSKRVNDTDFIVKEYTALKVEGIMRKLLVAAKGGYPLKRYLNRIFPKYAKHPEQTYTLEQILQNYNVIQGDRLREDMYYIWKYILENKLAK